MDLTTVFRCTVVEPWRRNLYVLWVIEFFAFAGLSLILPFIPLYVRQLGVTDMAAVTQWSGLLLAGPFMVSFIATPVWGAMGDRYGQKPMVVRALVGSALAYLGMGLATSVQALFAWRLAMGAVTGFLAAGMALLAVTTPEERRGYALGTLQAVVPAAGLVGPVLGGVLADVVGYRPIFFIVGAMLFLSGLVSAFALTEGRSDEPAERTRVRDNLGTAWGRPVLRLALLTVFASQATLNTIQPVFVLFVESLGVEARYLSTTSGALLAATGLASLVAAPQWGKRGDRLGFERMLRFALAGAMITLFCQGLVRSAGQLLVLRLLYGLCVAGVLPSIFGIVSTHSPAERRGGIMGLTSSATMLGNLVGPIAGGFIAGHFGLRAVFLVSAMALGGVIAARGRARS